MFARTHVTSATVPAPPTVVGHDTDLAHEVVAWFDDALSAETCADAWAAEGIGVRVRRLDGAAGSAAAALGESIPEALLLHVTRSLPEQLQRLRELRALAPTVPLLVLSRGLRDIDQVLALEMGADDVIDAGTAAPVVAARLRAIWRRSSRTGADSPSAATEELRFGTLQLQWRERRVLRDGQAMPLTEGEFEVLWLLASRAGSVVSRHEILKTVRGIDDQPLDRSVDCRVYRIRAKLGDDGAQRIRTVRHRGYLFSPAGW